MSFESRLKQIIHNFYKSQVELAKDLKVSKVAISEYLNAKRKPNYNMLKKFYDLGYNINWLISGKGTLKRHFVNEDELDQYDKIAFKGYINFHFYQNDNYTKEDNIIQKEIIKDDSSMNLIKNRWHPEIASDISNLLIFEVYKEGVVTALYGELYNSKFYKYLDYFFMSTNDQTSEYFKNSFISDISEHITDRPSKKEIVFKLNKVLTESEESEFYFNLACLYYLLTELVDFETMIHTQITSEFAQNKLEFDDLKPMFIFLIEQIRNNNYIETKGNRYKSSIKEICKIEYE